MDSRPTTAEDYSRELARGVARLRFEPVLEAEYLQSQALRARPLARSWQALQCILGVAGIQVLHHLPAEDDSRLLLYACNIVQIVISVLLAVLAFGHSYVAHYQRIAAVLTPVAASAIAIVIAAVVNAGGTGTSVMMISLFGLLFFSGLQLRQALPAAIAMTVAFPAALAAWDVHTALAAYSTTSLIVVLGLAGFVAWDMQRAAREAFLEHGITRADARRDGLTGLVNRRHFDARLGGIWNACRESGKPLALMLIDVDHFKAYNDRYGHQAGDEVLRRVAQALQAETRNGDVIARFGGEEMALIATGLDDREVEALAGSMRRAVETLAITHDGSPDHGRVTVSIGGACLVPLPGRSSAGALQLADENLYEAKRQGRNRTVIHADQYRVMRTGAFQKAKPA